MTKLKPLVWTEVSKPNEECRYDHVKAETPLGVILITWKSWKEDKEYVVDEHPVKDVAFNIWEDDLENTKRVCEEKLLEGILQLLEVDDGV